MMFHTQSAYMEGLQTSGGAHLESAFAHRRSVARFTQTPAELNLEAAFASSRTGGRCLTSKTFGSCASLKSVSRISTRQNTQASARSRAVTSQDSYSSQDPEDPELPFTSHCTSSWQSNAICGISDEGIPPDPNDGDSNVLSFRGIAKNAGMALFVVCLGVADNLSLGALFFPSSEEHPNVRYRSLGMCIGLLTCATTNVVLASRSQMPFSVGGMILPIVPTLAEYFRSMGPENAATIIVLIPLLTMVFGLTMYLAGWFGVCHMVEYCPFPVYAGFIAGSGIKLIECGINLVFKDFVSLVELSSYWALACPWGLRVVVPVVVGAFVCFSLPRHTRLEWHYILAFTLVCLAVYTYGYMHIFSISYAEAREQGLLFPVHRPSGLSDVTALWKSEFFYVFPKGTVQWHLLLSTKTLTMYVQMCTLGCLTIMKNLYGITKNTKSDIDLDKEVCTHGIASMISGLCGGAPGTTVVCYSAIANKFGARDKSFSWFVVLWSSMLFIFGEYVAAYLPKMIPACILLYLGVLLSWPFVWDLYGACSKNEYRIIVAMIFLDLTLGCGFMLLAGLVLTLVQTTAKLVKVPCIRERYSLNDVKSDVMRPWAERNLLKSHGERAHVLRLEAGYISFWMVSEIQEEVAQLLESPIEYLILDMELSTDVSIGALNFFTELVEEASVMDDLLVMFTMPNGSKVLHSFQRYQKSRRISVDTLEESEDEVLGIIVRKDLMQAAEFIEEEIIRCNPTKIASLRKDFSKASQRLSLTDDFKSSFKSDKVDGNAYDACFAVIFNILCALVTSTSPTADLRTWPEWSGMNHRLPCSVNDVTSLAKYLEVKTVCAGEVIYEGSISNLREPIPPLCWVISGDVDHTFNAPPELGRRLEKAMLTKIESGEHGPARECIGPLSTVEGFRGGRVHVGKLTAVRDSEVALLTWERYLALMKEEPGTASMLHIYLERLELIEWTISGQDQRQYAHLYRNALVNARTEKVAPAVMGFTRSSCETVPFSAKADSAREYTGEYEIDKSFEVPFSAKAYSAREYSGEYEIEKSL